MSVPALARLDIAPNNEDGQGKACDVSPRMPDRHGKHRISLILSCATTPSRMMAKRTFHLVDRGCMPVQPVECLASNSLHPLCRALGHECAVCAVGTFAFNVALVALMYPRARLLRSHCESLGDQWFRYPLLKLCKNRIQVVRKNRGWLGVARGDQDHLHTQRTVQPTKGPEHRHKE